MRVAVLGNCQTLAFANALLLYLPGAEVVRYGLDQAGTAERAEEIAAGLGQFDHVFAQPEQAVRFGPLRAAPLAAARPDTVFFPSIGFNGFHPDCIYLDDRGGRLGSPLGPYHSAIAAAAFSLGLPEDRTAALYNALVYARLGYFEDHGRAAGALVARGRAMGFRLGEWLPLWQRERAFMLTINHPRSLVMADLAWMALRRVGRRRPRMEDASDMLGEPLTRMAVFPVYPEIGRRLGVPGHYLFRGELLAHEPTRASDLRSFVAQCFAGYRAMPARVAEAVAAHPRASAVAAALSGMLRPEAARRAA